MISEAVDRVGRIRATAGGSVDLCLELQRRMKRGETIALAHAVEKYTPMFLEGLTTPGGTSNWALVTWMSRIEGEVCAANQSLRHGGGLGARCGGGKSSPPPSDMTRLREDGAIVDQ